MKKLATILFSAAFLLAGCKSLGGPGFVIWKSGDKDDADSRNSWGDKSEGSYVYEDYRKKQEEKNKSQSSAGAASSTASKSGQSSSSTSKVSDKSSQTSSFGSSVSSSGSSSSRTYSSSSSSSRSQDAYRSSSSVSSGGKSSDSSSQGGSGKTGTTNPHLNEAYLEELRGTAEYKAIAGLNAITPRGIVTPEELKQVDALTTAPVVIGNVESKGRRAGVFTSDNYRAYDTWQFSFKRKSRIKSFGTINGAGKDYNLVQSPLPGVAHYYFITDRINSSFAESGNALEKDIEEYKDLFSPADFEKVKKSMEAGSRGKGLGALEIVVCESVQSKDGQTEILHFPRFINLKDLLPGNKLGFTVFQNPEKNRVEMIFSTKGKLHLATSVNGIDFKYEGLLSSVNSDFTDRDPSVSPDGKTLVFASTRTFNSNLMGLQLFIAHRNSLSEPFSTPVAVDGAINTLGEIFPSVFQSSKGKFIFFKIFDKSSSGYNENIYSMEVRDGVFLPMVPFAAESDIPHKYITISYSEKRGYRVMASYPVNDFDLYHIEIDSMNPVFVDSSGNVLSEDEAKAIRNFE